MKKVITLLLAVVLCIPFAGCSSKSEGELPVQVSQMKSICELATIKAYYHNVAKYSETDVEHILWWTKDRRFWVEYEGYVNVGIDVSLLDVKVSENTVTITLPPAKIMGSGIEEESLNEDGIIVDKNSAKVEAKHQTEAFADAQAKMEEEAEKNTGLLALAQQRAKKLLEDYIKNIGDNIGESYDIEWVFLENAEELSNMEVE